MVDAGLKGLAAVVSTMVAYGEQHRASHDEVEFNQMQASLKNKKVKSSTIHQISNLSAGGVVALKVLKGWGCNCFVAFRWGALDIPRPPARLLVDTNLYTPWALHLNEDAMQRDTAAPQFLGSAFS